MVQGSHNSEDAAQYRNIHRPSMKISLVFRGTYKETLAYHVTLLFIPVAPTVHGFLRSNHDVFISSSKSQLLPSDFQLVYFGWRELDCYLVV